MWLFMESGTKKKNRTKKKSVKSSIQSNPNLLFSVSFYFLRKITYDVFFEKKSNHNLEVQGEEGLGLAASLSIIATEKIKINEGTQCLLLSPTREYNYNIISV
jgi:hypothetical protein